LVSQSVRLAKDSALRSKLGEAGRTFVAEERSWEKLSRRYLQHYNDALNAQREKTLASVPVSEK